MTGTFNRGGAKITMSGSRTCPKCGNEMIPWGYVVIGHPEKGYDGIICQTCGHEEKLKDGEKR
jgi:DNA-directed RNA polymerase subunit RPC12/RpoP